MSTSWTVETPNNTQERYWNGTRMWHATRPGQWVRNTDPGPRPTPAAPAPSGGGGGNQTITPTNQSDYLQNVGNRSAALADPFAPQRGQYQEQLSTLMKNPGEFASSPTYKFAFDQGMDAVNRTSAAKGQLGSGNRLLDLTNYGQGQASQQYFKQADLLGLLSGAKTSSPAAAGSAYSYAASKAPDAFNNQEEERAYNDAISGRGPGAPSTGTGPPAPTSGFTGGGGGPSTTPTFRSTPGTGGGGGGGYDITGGGGGYTPPNLNFDYSGGGGGGGYDLTGGFEPGGANDPYYSGGGGYDAGDTGGGAINFGDAGSDYEGYEPGYQLPDALGEEDYENENYYANNTDIEDWWSDLIGDVGDYFGDWEW